MASLDLTTFWADRLTKAIALLALYDDAISQLASGAVQSYSLNTGQSTQQVTKVNLTSLAARRDGLLNEIATLDARISGGSTHVVPNA